MHTHAGSGLPLPPMWDSSLESLGPPHSAELAGVPERAVPEDSQSTGAAGPLQPAP